MPHHGALPGLRRLPTAAPAVVHAHRYGVRGAEEGQDDEGAEGDADQPLVEADVAHEARGV